MALEIERKFLVDTTRWTPSGQGTRYVQGYLSSHPERVVRVRQQGEAAKLTIKGAPQGAHGIARVELEYDVPAADLPALLALCERPLIEKTRHVEQHGGTRWEIDVFEGDNAGLVVAEVELPSEDAPFSRPPWLGADVSHDPRYVNANLVANPFTRWPR